jgi:hypothetical protein
VKQWTWQQVDNAVWRLYRRGEPSVGRIGLVEGVFTGYWRSHPLVRDASLDDVQDAVEAAVRSKPWIPFLEIVRAS